MLTIEDYSERVFESLVWPYGKAEPPQAITLPSDLSAKA
jgi:hypothetical protein